MNRKSKVIVSIVGILVVLLALLGITYAYYLTRIQGNTNTNSISITTADLTLKYDDGSSYINLTNIMPGTTTDGEGDNPLPKIFTVTNDGSGDVEYSVGMDEVTNTLTRTQDLTYSITCQEKLITTADTEYTACATTPSNSGEYPKTNSYLFTNQIKQDYIQKYTVVISYANPNEDQSIDMGSTIKGRMQIYSVPESIDITGTVTGASSGDYVQINSNPKTSVIANDGTYKLIGVEPGSHTLSIKNGNTTKGTKEIVVKQGTSAGIDGSSITFTESERVATVNITSISPTLSVNITEIVEDTTNIEPLLLKDIIIANAQKAATENSTTRSIYSETPLTTPVLATSGENERTLSLTSDDYGNSYYFRGNIDDNYVNFAGMCWRIVRIAGDGSVKLILEDAYAECNDNETAVTTDVYTGNWSDGNTYVFGYDDSTGSYRLNFLNYEGGLVDSFNTFQNDNLTSTDLQKLKIDEWCYDDKVTATSGSYEYYGAYTRINTNEKASLICTGTKLTKYKDGTDMYVGTLTADEMSFAGATISTNYNYYLMNTYAKDNNLCWWSLSPFFFSERDGGDFAFHLDYSGVLSVYTVYDYVYSRPAVSLKSGSVITGGEGTLEKPYIIAE